jgi:hypothetical protein
VTERAAKSSSFAMLNWVILLGAVIALVAVAAFFEWRKNDSVRLVLVANSALTAGGLEACLSKRVLLTSNDWLVSAEEAARRQAWNGARTIEADVSDLRTSRRLQVFTVAGKPLSDEQSESVKTCLRGG